MYSMVYTRESVYLEKRNFGSIDSGIENNIELCNKLIELYENNIIYDESLIHIIAVIDGVKQGASFSDSIFFTDDRKLNNPHEIRETELYNTLVEYEVPFRVDVYGRRSPESNIVSINDNTHSIYTIAQDFESIQILPPFHHIGEDKSMSDVKYHGSGDLWRPCLSYSRSNGL